MTNKNQNFKEQYTDQITNSENIEKLESYEFERKNEDVVWIAKKVNQMRTQFAKSIIGQHELIELLLTGVIANGHILLEGVPGVAKTLSAKVMAKMLDVHFSRIQFTPDLMPSDVIGTSVYDLKSNEFSFNKGPVFANIILIDEINRAPAKTQAALFEVMEERQITYDGICYDMKFPFLVIATQNPIDHEGTYNLPEAQLDRFLFKISVQHPTLNEEEEILTRYKNQLQTNNLTDIQSVFSEDELKKIQQIVEQTIVEQQLLKYIVTIVNQTRNHSEIYLGASTRASLALLNSSKALAIIRGRDFITPEDIQFLAPYVLNHRLILTPEAEINGITSKELIEQIIKDVEVPR